MDVPNLWKQAANLRRLHPTFTVQVRGEVLEATGAVRGNPLTNTYQIRILYERGYCPRVFVLDPPLERRHPDQQVAHTNGPNEPCLFTGTRDWRPSLYLGQTVIPWLMEWIVFYETWVLTGNWLGGGTLPPGYDDVRPVPEVGT